MSVATGAVLEDSVLEQLPASQAVAADVATAAVDDSSSLTSSLDEFEGPEKVVEVDFSPTAGPVDGVRQLTRANWEDILSDAGITILSAHSGPDFDSFVLSESSLFVYPHNVLLKTCGRSTPFLCLTKLQKYSEALGCEIEWLAFMRKNFTYPTAQLFPHVGHSEEVKYLHGFLPGDMFVLGALTGDHWFVFIADRYKRLAAETNDRTLDIMMFDVDQSVAALFYHDGDGPGDEITVSPSLECDKVTAASGIHGIFPGAFVHGWVFAPCGYSCNGVVGSSYFTIHVTPQEKSSYVSFGTNVKLADYSDIVQKVLAIFKPQRFTMTMFADLQGVKEIACNPFRSLITIPAPTDSEAATLLVCTSRAQVEYKEYKSYLANYRLLRPEALEPDRLLDDMSWP